jgi:PAS domain-containing protein
MERLLALTGSGSLQDTTIALIAVISLSYILVLVSRHRSLERHLSQDRATARRLGGWYEAVTVAGRDGFVLQTTDGVVLDLNVSASGMLGVDRRAAIGCHINDLLVVVVDENGQMMVPAAVFGYGSAKPQVQTARRPARSRSPAPSSRTETAMPLPFSPP